MDAKQYAGLYQLRKYEVKRNEGYCLIYQDINTVPHYRDYRWKFVLSNLPYFQELPYGHYLVFVSEHGVQKHVRPLSMANVTLYGPDGFDYSSSRPFDGRIGLRERAYDWSEHSDTFKLSINSQQMTVQADGAPYQWDQISMMQIHTYITRHDDYISNKYLYGAFAMRISLIDSKPTCIQSSLVLSVPVIAWHMCGSLGLTHSNKTFHDIIQPITDIFKTDDIIFQFDVHNDEPELLDYMNLHFYENPICKWKANRASVLHIYYITQTIRRMNEEADVALPKSKLKNCHQKPFVYKIDFDSNKKA
jgi:hypothetical protein